MEAPGSGFKLSPPCLQCGYLTGILNKIPPRNPPIDLIRSHYLLSLTERTSIQAEISSSELSIQTLEAEISKLQAATRLIQSRLLNIRKYADSYKALISPWCRLPEDVLREIFYYVCDKPVNVLSKSGAHWILQQVCSRWRNVVQNTPLLWSVIAAIPDDMDVQTLTGQSVVMERTGMCVELSKTVPLSITSSFSIRRVSTETAHHTILKRLSTHAHRWTCLNLDGNSFRILLGKHRDTTPLIQSGGLPCLRELSLLYDHDTGFDIFEGVNTLEKVLFESCVLPEVLHSRGQTLTVEEFDIGSLFGALHNLEELEWRFIYFDCSPILSPVTLPSLRKVNVELSPALLKAMLMLRVPRLAELRVVWERCKVKKLELKMDYSDDIIPILQKAAYDVEELSLILTSPLREEGNEVLTSLEWRPAPVSEWSDAEGVSTLLPSLQMLTLQPFGFDYSSVVVDDYVYYIEFMVRSRASKPPNTVEREKLPLVPLSSVACNVLVAADEVEKYRVVADNLRWLGEQCGVHVEFDFKEKKEETTDS